MGTYNIPMNKMISSLILLLLAFNLEASQVLYLSAPSSDGILVDFMRDFYKEVGKQAKLSIRIVTTEKEKAIKGADLGKYDGLGLRVEGVDKVYKNLEMLKISPLNVTHIVFTASANKSITKELSLDNLAHVINQHQLQIGYLHGSKKSERELAGVNKDLVHPFKNINLIFKMLVDNEIDLYLAGPGRVSRQIIKEKGLQDRVKELSTISKFPLFPYLHRKHIHLVPVLEDAVKKLVSNGTVKRLKEKHFKE